MKLRTRLILAFAYIVVTVTLALAVPLGITLERRAESEFRATALGQGQALAAAIHGLEDPQQLAEVATEAADVVGGRVIVVDTEGTLVADSEGAGLIGTSYSTPSRPEIVRALEDGMPATRAGRSGTLDEDILAVAVPILDGPQVLGAVRISRSREAVQAQTRRAMLALAGVALAGLFAGGLLAILMARSLARPLTRLAEVARRAGTGDLQARVGKLDGPKEISDLASAFDRMAARIERTVKARERFASDASHQLRTPLTGLRLRLETASEVAPKELKEGLRAAEVEATRLGEIVERLLVLSRQQETLDDGERLDLSGLIREVAVRWLGPAEQQGASLESSAVSVEVMASRTDLHQVLDNLVDNALRYGGSEISIRSEPSGDRALITVEDNGEGIAPEDRHRVLERFARGTGATGGGSGLGLSIARELAERWGGAISIGESSSGGARIEVDLPRA